MSNYKAHICTVLIIQGIIFLPYIIGYIFPICPGLESNFIGLWFTGVIFTLLVTFCCIWYYLIYTGIKGLIKG